MHDEADGLLIRLQRHLGITLGVLRATQWQRLADRGSAQVLARLIADTGDDTAGADGPDRSRRPDPGS